MDKKLFVVRWEVEVVVLAESEEAAVDIAEGEAHDVLLEQSEPEGACEMSHLPGGWDMDSLVYGCDDDTPLGELIEAGAAPAYKVKP